MNDIAKRAKTLNEQIASDIETLNVANLEQQKTALEAELAKPDAWNDVDSAQNKAQQLSKLTQRIEPWREIEASKR